MSSAQRDLPLLDDAATELEVSSPFALKEQVAERLAAHRARRSQSSAVSAVTPIAGVPITGAPITRGRSAGVAAKVAERYANSPSYRAFLAEQAEAAIREAEAASRKAEAASRQAEATAEIAALNAQAVADAQYDLLAELNQWPDASAPQGSTNTLEPAPDTRESGSGQAALAAASAKPNPGEGLTVRLYEEVPRGARQPITNSLRACESLDEAEGMALDDEIAFRHAPVFDEFSQAVDIPANLIEFPRQLVAARRARPRLAEGPLREDAGQTADPAQLRIFEVEANQISTAAATEAAAPEWSSILLAAHPVCEPVVSADTPFSPVFAPQTAALSLRVMSAMVDGCLVGAGFLAFVATAAVVYGRLAAGHIVAPLNGPMMSRPAAIQTAAIGAVVTLTVLAVLYQLLFFTFSEATPGMRYARIGLCSFTDENPSRRAMRRRLVGVLLAACPLGVGFLWAWLDEEGLGWHDRISRMYQRSY